MRPQVVPLLPASAQADGTELLGRVAGVPHRAGPRRPRTRSTCSCTDGRVTGVIDWTDAQIGDPALDLSWLLNGAPTAIAEGVAETYGVSAELRARAHDWHRLGPWYEVGYGIETGQAEFVESGLSGVLKRTLTARQRVLGRLAVRARLIPTRPARADDDADQADHVGGDGGDRDRRNDRDDRQRQAARVGALTALQAGRLRIRSSRRSSASRP